MIVDRLSAMEDIRGRAEDANANRIDEKKNLKEELRRLGEMVGRSEKSEVEKPGGQRDEKELEH